MEPITTLVATAAGYILKGAADSKTAATAKEQLLGNFWKWIKPKFIKELPAIEDKPEDPATARGVQDRLQELIDDKDFFHQLQEQIALLRQAGIKEKNIVIKDITNVKKIHIGDRDSLPGETYQRKNIIEGNITGADELTLGDGH